MTAPRDVQDGLARFGDGLLEFLREYRELCSKHRLFILADGEEIQIEEPGPDDLKHLWGLENYEIAAAKNQEDAGE